MSTIQNPRKTWLATESLLTVWWRMLISGSLELRLEQPLAFKLWLSLACFSASRSGEGPVRSRLALLWCSLNPLLVHGPGCELEPFSGQILSLFCFPSLEIPQFGLLSHISSLRLSSGHSGLVLTLRTDNATHAPLSSPCLLVADASVWATSLLGVAVRHLFCGLFFSFLSVMLPSEMPKLPTDPPVRGFPAVWKFLLHDSLPRSGLHP